MKKILENISENREAFLKLRKTHIGASDVPTILGLNRWKSPFELWAEKTTDIIDADNDTDHLWYGREAEDLVAKLFLRRNPEFKLTAPDSVFVHNEYEWLTCSPDRFIDNDGLLECKTTISNNDDWSCEKAPDYAHCQLITQMAVTGLEWGHCGVIIGGDVNKSYFPRFEFSDELWEQILPILSNFYQCIKFNTPPETRSGDLAVINKFFKTENTEIDLSDDVNLQNLIKQYEDVKYGYEFSCKTVNKLKEELDKISADIRFEMGINSRAKCGAYLLELKKIEKKAYSVNASSYEIFKIRRVENGKE